ncbi:MAG: rod-binding protein [Cellulosilyticum sp.]|nr:rod-binding protein [Cellulosilyticum sp.]
MDISGISSYLGMQQDLAKSSAEVSGDDFKNALNQAMASGDDTELRDACDTLESYMIGMVLKQVKESMMQDDEDSLIPKGDYVKTFEEHMINSVADSLVEAGGLGLSNQLYTQIKNSYGTQMEISSQNQAAMASVATKVDNDI